MINDSCIALLLAGGEGKRLAPLTGEWAKPAVPFGGRYRIIDFPLSNCVNSGIENIAVFTQYKSESLDNHIGDGAAWLGSKKKSGIRMLPSSRTGSDYRGTADAIYQNIDYIDSQNPEDVLILSGDHIYRMDYRPLMEYHRQQGASSTIVVKQVPWKDASRFGIMNTDKSFNITDFVEKPSKPESNLASMGIYVFRWADLRKYLIEDAYRENSSHDFGKDIIPMLLQTGKSLKAYPFEGYWRDVGTVDSLWESNMDLIEGEFQLNHLEWPIHSSEQRSSISPALSPYCQLRRSVVQHGCSVEGLVHRSVISSGVHIGKDSSISDSYVMPNAVIGKNVRISRAIIGEGAIIGDNAVIEGTDEEIKVVAPRVHILSREYSMTSLSVVKGVFQRDSAVQKPPLVI
jgi:glucose-1-phosphate adenylyltransferase